VQVVAPVQDVQVDGQAVQTPDDRYSSASHATGVVQAPITQLLLAQSAALAQARPDPQRAHSGPPQSTSVSWPFLALSRQFGAWQVLSKHTLLAQSEPMTHGPAVAQPMQLPPQSTPVSSPFLTPSVQLAPRHVPFVQTPVAQSAPATQPEPAGQSGQTGPPQSTLVSPPFLTPSVQTAAAQTPSAPQTPVTHSVPEVQGVPLTVT
jgi:hypothetical protein